MAMRPEPPAAPAMPPPGIPAPPVEPREQWRGEPEDYLAAMLLVLVVVIALCVMALISFAVFGAPQPAIKYRHDARTGLCFAQRGKAIATVPCSPEVLRLVPQDQRGAP